MFENCIGADPDVPEEGDPGPQKQPMAGEGDLPESDVVQLIAYTGIDDVLHHLP